MKPMSQLLAASFLAFAAGCATAPDQVSRASVNAHTRFTMEVLRLARMDAPLRATDRDAVMIAKPMVKQAGDRYAIVQCQVDARGVTRDVQLVEASDTESAQAAVKVIARGHFVNAKEKNGQPMAVAVEYGLVFHPGESWSLGPSGGIDDHWGPAPTAEQAPMAFGPSTVPFPNSTYQHQ